MRTQSRSTMRRLLGAGLAAGLALSVLTIAPASAKPIDRGSFVEEFSFVVDDFCDVDGLSILIEGSFEVRFIANTRKPGTAPYFVGNERVEQSYTNESGVTVTEIVTTLNKDQKITDNGDGTLTILVLATGGATVYGPDGKAIARNPGQVRWEVLIDHNGTPGDPEDDVFLEDLGVVKGSTGRTDDFCAAVVPVLS
ncbi:hypothetical protein [Agromyces marinus]|uniref:Uncharacterized protein n=1 Tax=Agromyces marinus TaxID=1389020 RepID=A0ABN6Y9S1_9MICO|nr:hypothetical protein [Agromyces marinus]UIP57882.1 hypothetical protein DSM26151_07480 [Agromyces marinus]BDZ53923.1 hypothetical protein GCM10025870_09960 [Agromyces marinus]